MSPKIGSNKHPLNGFQICAENCYRSHFLKIMKLECFKALTHKFGVFLNKEYTIAHLTKWDFVNSLKHVVYKFCKSFFQNFFVYVSGLCSFSDCEGHVFYVVHLDLILVDMLFWLMLLSKHSLYVNQISA